MPLPKIIAVCGAKRSGKDTLANYLVNNYAYIKLAFADPLKLAVSTLFGFSEKQVGIGYDGDDKDMLDEKWGITPRQALQFFGTEVMQYKIQELIPSIDRRFLALSLSNRIRELQKQHIVISDMRFLHEYEELKKVGNVFVIRVDREHTDTPLHCSEIDYKNIPYDLLLHNDKDIETFLEEVDTYIKEL
jgi:hypothetical protein